jgi:uncharacterized protein (DUF58 family)
MQRRAVALLLGAVCVAATYVFGKVEGGFFAWFLFYFTCTIAIYEWITMVIGLRFVSTERNISACRLSAGQTLTIQLTLQRRGLWPLFWVRVREALPGQWLLQVQGADTVLQPLWARELRWTYQVQWLQRGLYVIGDTIVETGDLLGLVRSERRDERRDEVMVYPRVVPVRGWMGYQPVELGLRQPTRRRAEESTNVLGVRDYVPGDRLSRIHWPASARRGTLQAKEFELHVSSEWMFIPDLASTSFGEQSPSLFELEMTVVASLMKHAYQLRRTFAATLHGKKLTKFPPGCDESLFLRCMEALALAEPNGSVDFPQTLVRVAQDTPMGTTLVVVSPRLDPDAAVAAEVVRRRTPVEWFVPVARKQGELSAEQRQGLAMLHAARVNVYLIGAPEQLATLKRGGGQRVTSV